MAAFAVPVSIILLVIALVITIYALVKRPAELSAYAVGLLLTVIACLIRFGAG